MAAAPAGVGVINPAIWLIIWTVITGPDDPRLLRTIAQTPSLEHCEALATQITLAQRFEGNVVIEIQCSRERPKGVRRPSDA